jgi:inositol phosphorylceramide synthase catalytic subunit
MISVTIQVIFPYSAPWYENIYGLVPANYSIYSKPAGLARINKLFGKNLYILTFTASLMVFGAFPSLHFGDLTLETLFMSYYFPKLRLLFAFYIL